jgi:hypothetical protein
MDAFPWGFPPAAKTTLTTIDIQVCKVMFGYLGTSGFRRFQKEVKK